MNESVHKLLPKVSSNKLDFTNRLIIDIESISLSKQDIDIISHQAIGGVILFEKNYQNRTQIKELCSHIHNLKPDIKITVDQEGGRVQRFKQDFTIIPPMLTVGKIYQNNPQIGIDTAFSIGQILAEELIEVGIDFTLAPVLDLDLNNNQVIGNRAFSNLPNEVVILATSFGAGLSKMGMPIIGKHFPGHGYVNTDTHNDYSIDNRSLGEIENSELIPYHAHEQIGLNAVMMSHVIYQQIDPNPAGYSKFWVEYLQNQLNFIGLIISDDLSMQAAKKGNTNLKIRCQQALIAGCDLLIVCNDRNSVINLLNELPDLNNNK